MTNNRQLWTYSGGRVVPAWFTTKSCCITGCLRGRLGFHPHHSPSMSSTRHDRSHRFQITSSGSQRGRTTKSKDGRAAFEFECSLSRVSSLRPYRQDRLSSPMEEHPVNESRGWNQIAIPKQNLAKLRHRLTEQE